MSGVELTQIVSVEALAGIVAIVVLVYSLRFLSHSGR